jgi:hypothetical protein
VSVWFLAPCICQQNNPDAKSPPKILRLFFSGCVTFLFSSRCMTRSCPCPCCISICSAYETSPIDAPLSFPFFLTCQCHTCPHIATFEGKAPTPRAPQAFSHPPAFPYAITKDAVLTRTKTCSSPSHASASSRMATSRASPSSATPSSAAASSSFAVSTLLLV